MKGANDRGPARSTGDDGVVLGKKQNEGARAPLVCFPDRVGRGGRVIRAEGRAPRRGDHGIALTGCAVPELRRAPSDGGAAATHHRVNARTRLWRLTSNRNELVLDRDVLYVVPCWKSLQTTLQ